MLHIELWYDLADNPWFASIWATVFTWGSREWLNDSCQLQPNMKHHAGEHTLHRCAEMH